MHLRVERTTLNHLTSSTQNGVATRPLVYDSHRLLSITRPHIIVSKYSNGNTPFYVIVYRSPSIISYSPGLESQLLPGVSDNRRLGIGRS